MNRVGHKKLSWTVADLVSGRPAKLSLGITLDRCRPSFRPTRVGKSSSQCLWAQFEGGVSGSVLSKTAIFPGMREENIHSFNKSVQGWSLRKANVQVSTKGTPHDGQDTEKTLRTIIWYKRACIRQTTRQPSLAVPTS